MGDDCTVPNATLLKFEDGTMLSAFLKTVEKYVPHMSLKQHTIWVVENDDRPIAFLDGEMGTDSYIEVLAIEDIPVKELADRRIYCRYFYDFQGYLNTELSSFINDEWKKAHPECRTLLDCVKAYYDLPVSERWGWS